jgi:hypothetical protein
MLFYVLEARIVTRGHLCLLLSYSLPVTLASVLLNLPRILSLFPIGSLLQVSQLSSNKKREERIRQDDSFFQLVE